MKRLFLVLPSALLIMACSPESDPQAEDASTEEVGVSEEALSYVNGCHFYVDSNYGGTTLWMARGTTIPNLKNYSMGDKISSARLLGGATTRMWIDSNYSGNNWYISADVPTLHIAQWGNLGDNASSVDCY